MQRLFPDIEGDIQPAPPIIPERQIDPDPSGTIESFRPKGLLRYRRRALFPKSRDQPPHLFYLSSTTRRLGAPCAGGAGALSEPAPDRLPRAAARNFVPALTSRRPNDGRKRCEILYRYPVNRSSSIFPERRYRRRFSLRIIRRKWCHEAYL